MTLMPEALGRERALVLNYLGYSLVDQNLKLEEALGMLRRAVELRAQARLLGSERVDLFVGGVEVEQPA